MVSVIAEVPADEAELVVDGLVEADLLRNGQPLRFVHPIVQSAVYRHMPAGLRSRRHREAARLLALAGATVEEVSQHLLRTAPARDPWVLEQLHAAGRRALASGAPDVAVLVLRRALEEDPATVDADLLLQLGLAEGLIRDADALGHLEQAFARSTQPAQLAQVALPLARGLAFRSRYAEAMDVVDTALTRAKGIDPEATLKLRAERLWLLESGNLGPSGFVAGAEELARGLSGATHGERLALGHLGAARLFSGASNDEVRSLARLALGEGRLLEEEGPESPSWLYAAGLLWVVGDYTEAEIEMLRGEQRAYDRGAPVALVQIRSARAWIHCELGDLAQAERLACDVLSQTKGRSSTGARYALACLVSVLTEAGRYDEAEAALANARTATAPFDRFDSLLLHARAELRIARGDLGGVDDLLAVGTWCEARGIRNPGEWAWRTDVAPGLALRGEPERARTLVDEDVVAATAFGVPRPLGRALQAAAMLSSGEERLRLLTQALDVLRPSPARLATAKAELHLGLTRRTLGRISEAQGAFRSALALADACGAHGLAAEARRLLLSVGARPRRTAVSGPDSLTPMEREVAQLVAAGRTNREAAQQLYVTVKAVEKHLRNAYLKLSIERRTELAGVLPAVQEQSR
jgi:DNA-binding CsgD family transcriptional regulator